MLAIVTTVSRPNLCPRTSRPSARSSNTRVRPHRRARAASDTVTTVPNPIAGSVKGRLESSECMPTALCNLHDKAEQGRAGSPLYLGRRAHRLSLRLLGGPRQAPAVSLCLGRSGLGAQ
jgi:hypothetical protein